VSVVPPGLQVVGKILFPAINRGAIVGPSLRDARRCGAGEPVALIPLGARHPEAGGSSAVGPFLWGAQRSETGEPATSILSADFSMPAKKHSRHEQWSHPRYDGRKAIGWTSCKHGVSCIERATCCVRNGACSASLRCIDLGVFARLRAIVQWASRTREATRVLRTISRAGLIGPEFCCARCKRRARNCDPCPSQCRHAR